jgi:glutamine amidotransferase
MCRFTLYQGSEICMEQVILKPNHSLFVQSYKSVIKDSNGEISKINCDGFGVAWYYKKLKPGKYTDMLPIWNSLNLKSLCQYIDSTCIFAHIRASSYAPVNQQNCHPFQYQRLLFMHNGKVEEFSKLRIKLLREYKSDEALDCIKGNTDSEYFFALCIDYIVSLDIDLETDVPNGSQMKDSVLYALRKIDELHKHKMTFNIAFTNGIDTIVTRYTNTEFSPSLYLTAAGECYCDDNDEFIVDENGKKKGIIISSEALSNKGAEWKVFIKNNIMVLKKEEVISYTHITL